MVSRLLVGALTFFTSAWPAFADEKIDARKARVEKNSAIYDVRLLGVEGQGWTDTKAPYDRFPAKAEKTVRPEVWNLSRHSAGLCVRFVTDSPRIGVRWELTSASLAMPHMPATGVSGVDLYVRDEKSRHWQWVGNGRPAQKANIALLASGLPEGKRECLLYFPLYNGVTSVEIEIDDKSSLLKAPPWPIEKPVVFYGTSITQGGCASRPGMVHTAILGRKLDCPIINLGFSGNGRMEPAVTELLAEIDASVYVIDCLPNLSAKEVAERTEPLVQTLRKARPNTPIVLVEDRTYTNGAVLPALRKRNDESRAALKAAYESLRRARITGLHYLPGENLLGDDGEGAVDGSHPTDLGFLRQAEEFHKVLAPILRKKS